MSQRSRQVAVLVAFAAWSWLVIAYARTMHVGLLATLRIEWGFLVLFLLPVGLVLLWFMPRRHVSLTISPPGAEYRLQLPRRQSVVRMSAVLLLALAVAEVGSSVEEARFLARVKERPSPFVYDRQSRWCLGLNYLLYIRSPGGAEVFHAGD